MEICEERNTNWKLLYETSEDKRTLVVRLARKATSDYEELRMRYKGLREDYESLYNKQQQTEEELNKLRNVSERVYREYETLRTKYNVEISAFTGVMDTASKWYRENIKLKRRSMVLNQEIQEFRKIAPGISVAEIDDDDEDESDEEMDRLKETNEVLQTQVVSLQKDLNQLKLDEFEAQEQLAQLTIELQQEKDKRIEDQSTKQKYDEIEKKFSDITKVVTNEIVQLRTQCEESDRKATTYQEEAYQLKVEKNVLAHRSTILMAEIPLDQKFNQLLDEVEVLKKTLEDERLQYQTRVQQLQGQISELSNTSEIELLNGKLEVVTMELGTAAQRYFAAEKEALALKERVQNLECELEEKNVITRHMRPCSKCVITSGDISVVQYTAMPPPIPAPLPPPPPPLPPAGPPSNPIYDLMHILGLKRGKSSKKGKEREKSVDEKVVVMANMIDDIKSGNYRLKPTAQSTKITKKETESVRNNPEAVEEMKNMLHRLKKVKRQSSSFAAPLSPKMR